MTEAKRKLGLERIGVLENRNREIMNLINNYDWSKLTTTMQATAQNWKAAEGPAKEMLLGKLKEMTAQKKALEAELDASIADKEEEKITYCGACGGDASNCDGC